MSDQFIDPERDIIYANRSPPLERIEPNFESTETPPPVLTVESSSESSDEDEIEGSREPKRGKGRIKRSQGDAVLILSLDPRQPDVANEAFKNVLASDTPPEAAVEDLDAGPTDHLMLQVDEFTHAPRSADEAKGLAAAAYEQTQKLEAAINHHERSRVVTDITCRHLNLDRPPSTPAMMNGIHEHADQHDQKGLSPAPVLFSSKRPLNTIPPPLPAMPQDRKYDESDSIATSPALAKFAIKSSEADPGATLPAMQTSPTRSAAANSPDVKQTLPSLETALGPIMEPSPSQYSAHSPHLGRQPSSRIPHLGPSSATYSQPSPNAGMSPPGIPSHQSYWRPATRDGSISTPSEYASNSASISTPASSILVHSPAASYPTPTTAISDQSRMNSQDDVMDMTSQPVGMIALMNPAPTPSFRCTVDGCIAPPFQTQYLLNSHMNVHSEARPHFCPVKNCPRGPGGQGFKRKNEMIRHGLVHTSPGYVCPFCPDQQHKYPRPDNLQRHVRVHHVDKARDDPALRDVLAQRPEGGNRGRRRRLGS